MNQGLKHLALQAEKQNVNFKDYSKVVIIPFLGFIDELIVSMRKYLTTPHFPTWGQYIVSTTPDKQLSNMYGSWLKYNLTSLQTKLISTLLSTTSTSKLSMFLKLRKLTLKTDFTTKSLDSLSLQHQDIIGIIHTAYTSLQSRKKVLEGVKSLFISFRQKQAKLESAVFIQFALSLQEQIRQNQTKEATVSHQKQIYGTIPQSILGYSSIISRGAEGNSKVTDSNKANQSTQSNNNTSQYISNFQSVIHDQNGLYRKIKSSQVSLQGFKVIDHKFHNNQYNCRNEQKNSQNASRSNPYKVEAQMGKSKFQLQQRPIKRIQTQGNNNFQIYNNRQNRRLQKHSYNEKYPPQPEKEAIQNQQSLSHVTPKKITKAVTFGMSKNNSQNNKQFEKPIQNSNISSAMKNSSIRNQQQYKQRMDLNLSKSRNSLSYSERFKSPDMSYELTPNTTQQKGDKYIDIDRNGQPVQDNRDKYHVGKLKFQENASNLKSSQMKLIKIEQQKQPEENIKTKEGGYQMWKRLNQRNQTFINKMLGSHQNSRVNQSNQLKQFKNQLYDEQKYDSINVIHNSIVRHFGVDKRQSPSNSFKVQKN